MLADALYVYGIVKFGFDLEWKELGLNKENVYIVGKGKFSALVHNCKEEPYVSKDPNEIKELIIVHNKVLDKAMEDFGGVIPLPFDTIIKKGETSSQDNLRKWLNDNKERLEKLWNKVKDKREYGIRIYYEKNKLIKEASKNAEIIKLEKGLEGLEGKSKGLKYLLHGKIKSKINEIVQNKINQFKQEFYNDIKKVTDDLVINVLKTHIGEENNDLLLKLSILVDKKQKDKIMNILEKRIGNGFSFNLTNPFAPYSFVENEPTK